LDSDKLKIFQSRSFENKIKKFSKQEKGILDGEIKRIIENPSAGEEKKGDLRGVYIHKFKIKTIQYLLSYRMSNDGLELIMIGPHENYYRDLKSYLKRR
jgi:mRNA-degrading endonuclease RelE of RelBE toxin-antitoxin system